VRHREGGGGLHWTGYGGAGHGGVLAGVGDGALQRGWVLVSGLMRGSRSGVSDRGEGHRELINVEMVGELPICGAPCLATACGEHGQKQGDKKIC
jgi:hypothetical protein